MPNKVVHFEIVGNDAKKSQEFYRALFGWTVDADNEYNYGMVDPKETGIGGGIGGGVGGPSHATFYVEVDDLQATLDQAERLGGKTRMPPDDVAGVTIAQFEDPDGVIIGLIKSGGATS